jgi:hypothetical protein
MVSEEDLQMTKLERVKRFLSWTSRPGLRVLSLVLLVVSAYAAQSGTVFSVSGTFEGGATLGGTITIDTIGNGGILSEDLTVNPVDITYTFNGPNDGTGLQSFSDSGTFFYDDALFFGNNNSELEFDIYLAGTNGFAGYTGGALCSDAQFCGGAETSFTVNTRNLENPGDPPLSSGTLSSATPEPSTALLAIGGGAAVLALRRRKRRA